MKRLLLLLCVLQAAVGAFADWAFRAHRYDVFSVMPTRSDQVLFVGNSITNMHPWGEAWGDNQTVANRGNSGGMSGEILTYIESFISGHPKELYLMIGTNDGMGNEANIPTVVSNIRQILKRITKESPQTKVYLENILQSTNGRTLACISECNRQLAAMVEAEYPGVTVVDLYNAVTGITGYTTSTDALHIAAPAYKMWMDEIKRVGGMDGYTVQYNSTCTGRDYAVGGVNGMRNTYFANLPTKSTDVLFIGDEFVNGGEWPELLANPNVQNRGWGWGFGGLSCAQYQSSLPYIFGGNRTESVEPAQVVIYAGTNETNGNVAIATIKAGYKSLVDAVRAKAPNAKITLVSLSPNTDATKNNLVNQLNAYMAELAAEGTNMSYADINTGLVANKAAYMNGNYVYGLGYIHAANVLKDHINGCGTVLTVEQAQAHKALLAAREDFYSQIALCEVMAGSSKGETKAILEALAEGAYELLASTESYTAENFIEAKSHLEAAMDNARQAVNLSFPSGWYQIANTKGVVVTSGKGLFMNAVDPGITSGSYQYDVLASADASLLSTLFYLQHEPNSNSVTITLSNGYPLGWNGTHSTTAQTYTLTASDAADPTAMSFQGSSYLDMFTTNGKTFLGASSSSSAARFKIYDAADVLGDRTPYRVVLNGLDDGVSVTYRKSGYTGLAAHNGGYIFVEGTPEERDFVVNGMGEGNSTRLTCTIDHSAKTITYSAVAPTFTACTLADLQTGWYQIKNITGRMTTEGQGKYLRAAESGIVRSNGTYDVIASDDNNSPYTYFYLNSKGNNKYTVKVITGNYVGGAGSRSTAPVDITFSLPDSSNPTDLHANGGNNWDMFKENGKIILGASSSSGATTFQLSNVTQWVEDNYDIYEVINNTNSSEIGVTCTIEGYDGVKAYHGGYIIVRDGYTFGAYDLEADASITAGKVVQIDIDRDAKTITLNLRDELEFSPVDANFTTGWYQIKNVEAKYTSGQHGLNKLVKFNETPIAGNYYCNFTDDVEDISTFFYLTHTPNSHQVTIQTLDGRYINGNGESSNTAATLAIQVKSGTTDLCSIGGYLMCFDNYQSKGDIWGKSSSATNISYYQLNNVDDHIAELYNMYKVECDSRVSKVVYNHAGYPGVSVRNGGYILASKGYTPQASDFICITTDAQAIAHACVDEDTKTVSVHVTYDYDYNAAKFALSHNMGSPADYTSEEYYAVKSAIEVFDNVYEMESSDQEYCDAIHDLAHALEDYFEKAVAENNLETPDGGKHYTLQLASGKTETYMKELGYLNFHTAGINLTDDPSGTDANVQWLCEARSGGKFSLAAEVGEQKYYLCWVGANGGENGNLGFTAEYNATVNDLEVLPLVKATNVTYANYQTIGLVYLRFANRSASDSRAGVLTFTPSLVPTNSDAPYYNGAYSSAFIMNEVKDEDEEIQYQEYAIESSTGKFAGSGSFHASWTSTDKNPAYMLSVVDGSANMQYTGDYVTIYTGSKTTSCEYKLTAQMGYTVVGYNFLAHNTSDADMTITTADGTVYNIAAGESVRINYVADDNRAITFTQAAVNKSIVLEQFKVFIREGQQTEEKLPVNMYINNETGTFTSTNAGGTWAAVWSSNDTEPQLKLSIVSSGANNMQWSNGNVDMRTGYDRPVKYRLSATAGYGIKSFSFTARNVGNNAQVITTPDGKQWNLPAGNGSQVEVSWDGGDNSKLAADIINTVDANTGFVAANFLVTLVPHECDGLEIFRYDGTPGYNIVYRIPAIASIPAGEHKGRIVTVIDYRPDNADIGIGQVDLHTRYSDDYGQTWSDEAILVQGDGDRSSLKFAYGDPGMIADRETGEVLVVSCSGTKSYVNSNNTDHQHMVAYYSADGEHWSEPNDVNQDIKSELDSRENYGKTLGWFVGSGGISQSRIVKKGTHYRVYAAILERNETINQTYGMAYVIYSDDFGRSWHILGGCAGKDAFALRTGGNEAKAEELPDGSVLCSIRRSSGGRFYNIWRWDNENMTTGHWDECAVTNNITACDCNGDIRMVPATRNSDNTPVWLAMQSVPTAQGSQRYDVKIYYKGLASASDYATATQFAQNWEGNYQVNYLRSGYSSMTLQEDGNIGVFTEESLRGITTGYSGVYYNLPLETITGGAYSVRQIAEGEFTDVTMQDPTHELVELIEKLKLYDQKSTAGTVGYPASASTAAQSVKTVLSQLNADNSCTKETAAAMPAIVTDYLGTADITLPQDGKVYTLTFVNYNRVRQYIDCPTGRLTINTWPEDDVLPQSAYWLCHVTDAVNGKFVFVNVNGDYLQAITGNSGDTGHTELYDEGTNQCTIGQMSKITSNNGKLTADNALGLLYISFAQRRTNNNTAAVLIDKFGPRTWDTTTAPFFTDTYTSGIYFEEVKEPALNNVVRFRQAKSGADQRYYTTYYNRYPTAVPEGATAYIATGTTTEGNLTLETIEGNVIPKNTAVILASEELSGDQTLHVGLQSAEVDTESNLLQGTLSATVATPANTFALSGAYGPIGFYHYTIANLPVGKAYYVQTENSNDPVVVSGVKGYMFGFGGETAIESVQPVVVEGAVHDLSGRRVQATKKGLYIINGKKVILK